METWGSALLVVMFLLVGSPVALAQVRGEDLLAVPTWVWWAAYVGYVVAFVGTFWPHGWWWLTPARVVVAMAALGGVVVGSAPQSWTPVLLVFTTATAAHVLSTRGTVAVAVVNSLFLLVVLTVAGVPAWEATFGALMYAGLQALTVWAVWMQLRETAARQRLAVVNTELRAATALLAESSRSTERLRIARDLHDLLGHQLTALALELEVASHKASPPADDHVHRARALAKDLLGDVRAAVDELRDRPADLHDALREVVADLPRPQVHLDVDVGLVVDSDRVATLVRCVQEVVTNTVRHAEADHLWIAVHRGDTGEIVLSARDDGIGTPALELGNGLTGMRERVEEFGGTVRFAGRPGFRVDAAVPAP